VDNFLLRWFGCFETVTVIAPITDDAFFHSYVGSSAREQGRHKAADSSVTAASTTVVVVVRTTVAAGAVLGFRVL